MKPVTFPEAEATYGRRLPPYVAMPVFKDNEEVISCWELSWPERFHLLVTGRLWLRQYTNGKKLNLEVPQVEVPFIRTDE